MGKHCDEKVTYEMRLHIHRDHVVGAFTIESSPPALTCLSAYLSLAFSLRLPSESPEDILQMREGEG